MAVIVLSSADRGAHGEKVAPPAKNPQPILPVNNTVKLTDQLRDRVVKAMHTGGFSVWSEFCRVALTEKCQDAERRLRENDPEKYMQIYGRTQHQAD